MLGGYQTGENQVRLLPHFGIEVGEKVVPIGTMGRRVIAILALAVEPCDRAVVSGTLWPHVNDHRAAANLRTTLWRIAQSTPDSIQMDGTSLTLNPSFDVDHHRGISTARDLLAHRLVEESDQSTDFASAIPVLSAELLSGWYDDWILVHQERWRQLRLHALDALADHLTSNGRSALAVEASTAAVDAEPLRESGYRCLMRAHLEQGNISEALRAHERYRMLLKQELGVDPSPRMLELVSSAVSP